MFIKIRYCLVLVFGFPEAYRSLESVKGDAAAADAQSGMRRVKPTQERTLVFTLCVCGTKFFEEVKKLEKMDDMCLAMPDGFFPAVSTIKNGMYYGFMSVLVETD